MHPRALIVIAHAGLATSAPEDSLPSVVAATRSGADGVEFDVNRSADGTWWLMHSPMLDETTAGQGLIHSTSDADLADLLIDGGMGFDPGRDGGGLPIPRLDEVLDVLATYDRIVIVDCKDDRPGSHTALARHLAARGRFTTIIARSPDLAGEVKTVDPRFRVIVQQDFRGDRRVGDSRVDDWLLDGETATPPAMLLSDAFEDFGVFFARTHWPRDESGLLGEAKRWDASFAIVNDVPGALLTLKRDRFTAPNGW